MAISLSCAVAVLPRFTSVCPFAGAVLVRGKVFHHLLAGARATGRGRFSAYSANVASRACSGSFPGVGLSRNSGFLSSAAYFWDRQLARSYSLSIGERAATRRGGFLRKHGPAILRLLSVTRKRSRSAGSVSEPWTKHHLSRF